MIYKTRLKNLYFATVKTILFLYKPAFLITTTCYFINIFILDKNRILANIYEKTCIDNYVLYVFIRILKKIVI